MLRPRGGFPTALPTEPLISTSTSGPEQAFVLFRHSSRTPACRRIWLATARPFLNPSKVPHTVNTVSELIFTFRPDADPAKRAATAPAINKLGGKFSEIMVPIVRCILLIYNGHYRHAHSGQPGCLTSPYNALIIYIDSHGNSLPEPNPETGRLDSWKQIVHIWPSLVPGRQ